MQRGQLKRNEVSRNGDQAGDTDGVQSGRTGEQRKSNECVERLDDKGKQTVQHFDRVDQYLEQIYPHNIVMSTFV